MITHDALLCIMRGEVRMNLCFALRHGRQPWQAAMAGSRGRLHVAWLQLGPTAVGEFSRVLAGLQLQCIYVLLSCWLVA